ncbi:hypothetical protein ElyMa_002316700 [Elysia marginata]|uniref:Uncharacterized protein n=1 Tax=Elysia marginata TaxID=1093978 RepID=A0AAV4G5N9_9GAST|nr:hypothetical protein ElyMa_002316700 [Elysia marginata]
MPGMLTECREDPGPQQQGSAKRTSRCQEGHLTRTAKVDRSDVIGKGGPKRRQQQRRAEATSTVESTLAQKSVILEVKTDDD